MASSKSSTPALLVPPSSSATSSSSSAVPIKSAPSHHRTVSSGSHRVSRRKSISSSTASKSAFTEALKEANGAFFSLSALQAESAIGNQGYPSPPSSLPSAGIAAPTSAPTSNGITFGKQEGAVKKAAGGSAIAEGHARESSVNPRPTPRNRRSSEGAHTSAGVAKGSRARSGSELRCEKCGKGYKHSSCLTKHLWEHTPEWSFTSKLLISKHQQVQLLEAASILVSMNPTQTPPSSASVNGTFTNNQDGSSSSIHDSSSSDDTTPPPVTITSPMPTPRGIRKSGKRYSGSYSRSYQGPPSLTPGNASLRTPTRGSVRATPGDDDALAAALGVLSCSFHTPVMGPSEAGSVPSMSAIGSPLAAGRSFTGGGLGDVMEMKKEEEADVKMEDQEDEKERWRRSEEEEDGVFGRMEE